VTFWECELTTTNEHSSGGAADFPKPKRLGRWIAIGLVLGVCCGVVFGEYCGFLKLAGQAYVGLLQMTVLPYLVLSLVAKMGRLNGLQARQMGVAVLVTLAILWLISVVLVVGVSSILPPITGASFFSSDPGQVTAIGQDLLEQFIPANVFRSLSEEYVPGIVVFCLFFGIALIPVPGKEPLLDFLDLSAEAIGRINMFLVRLAPLGLFALTAAAAGTLRVEELARLQAYLILFTLACLVAAFAVLPLLISSLTGIRYRDVLRVSQGPVLTAIATGKLFVVLPQIVDQCEELLKQQDESLSELGESTANIVVPLAYPFPHIGKILAYVFVSFAAWHVGRGLSPMETTTMASSGVISSFASPLVAIPYMLDQYQLPQDLMPLFILPGFITTRLADVVGVFHLMALTLIVSSALQGRLRFRWGQLAAGAAVVVVGLAIAGSVTRWYLASTTLEYDLDERLLSLEVPEPYDDVVVYRSREEVPSRPAMEGTTLERVRSGKVLRVGYHSEHLPYSFRNRQGHLVGFDVELMHHLAERLQVRLEFVPYDYETVIDQLGAGEIDLAVGGLVMTPDRLLKAEFTQPYQTATIAVLLPDHRRSEFDNWDDPNRPSDLRLGVVYEDMAMAARRQLPDVEIVVIDSFPGYFSGHYADLDGLLLPAEEGATWNVLYPEYTVVVPKPVVRRPVSFAARSADTDWIRFLDRWLDYERLDGSFERLRKYWIEGGGTRREQPRWSVLRDVLHWVP